MEITIELDKGLTFTLAKLNEIYEFWKSHGFHDGPIHNKIEEDKTYSFGRAYGFDTLWYDKDKVRVGIKDEEIKISNYKDKLLKIDESIIKAVIEFITMMKLEVKSIAVSKYKAQKINEHDQTSFRRYLKIDHETFQINFKIDDEKLFDYFYFYKTEHPYGLERAIDKFEEFLRDNDDFIPFVYTPALIISDDSY